MASRADSCLSQWRRYRVSFLLLLLSGVLLPQQALALDDEVDQLKEEYSEALKEYRQLTNTYEQAEDNNKQSDARDKIRQLESFLRGMKREIERLGGKVEDFRQIRKPGVIKEVKPGTQARGSSDGAESDPVPVAPLAPLRCESKKYLEYRRPLDPDTGKEITAIHLPPFWKQNAGTWEVGKELITVEIALLDHLVLCKEVWTLVPASKWAAQRERLANQWVQLEQKFLHAFTTGYDAKENALFGQAYANQRELNKNIKDEDAAWKKYAAFVPEYIRICAIAKLSPVQDHKLQCANAFEFLEQFYREWEKAANKVNNLAGIKLNKLKEANALQAKRGLAEMKKLHPGSDFQVHEAKQFTTISPLIKELLGSTGEEILKEESRRRRNAILKAKREAGQ